MKAKKIFFYQNYFTIFPQVFCPRYETEQLIDILQKYLRNWFKKSGKILEIGVGSGVIALTLKKIFPNWQIDAIDKNEQALKCAKYNQTQFEQKIELWKSDLFTNIKKKYHVIVANLPYVANTLKLSENVLKTDPHSALFAGKDGLKYIQKFLGEVSKFLEPKYLIALEIGDQQTDSIVKLIPKYLPNASFKVKTDYNQLTRFIFIYHDYL